MRKSIITACVTFTVLTTSGCAVTRNQEVRNATPHIDDQVITSNIKVRHAETPSLSLSCIRVEALYGIVLLSGFVENPLEKMTAQQITEQVDGVKSVHNEIIIQADDTGQKTAPSCRVSSGLRV